MYRYQRRAIAWSGFGAPRAEPNKMQQRGRLKGTCMQEKIPQYSMRYYSVITRRATDSTSCYLSVGARTSLGNSNLKSNGRAVITVDEKPRHYCHIKWITLQIHAMPSFCHQPRGNRWPIAHTPCGHRHDRGFLTTIGGLWLRLVLDSQNWSARKMKNFTLVLICLFVGSLATTWAVTPDQQIVLIRHGEKPADPNNNDLSPAGYFRAKCQYLHRILCLLYPVPI